MIGGCCLRDDEAAPSLARLCADWLGYSHLSLFAGLIPMLHVSEKVLHVVVWFWLSFLLLWQVLVNLWQGLGDGLANTVVA